MPTNRTFWAKPCVCAAGATTFLRLFPIKPIITQRQEQRS